MNLNVFIECDGHKCRLVPCYLNIFNFLILIEVSSVEIELKRLISNRLVNHRPVKTYDIL